METAPSRPQISVAEHPPRINAHSRWKLRLAVSRGAQIRRQCVLDPEAARQFTRGHSPSLRPAARRGASAGPARRRDGLGVVTTSPSACIERDKSSCHGEFQKAVRPRAHAKHVECHQQLQSDLVSWSRCTNVESNRSPKAVVEPRRSSPRWTPKHGDVKPLRLRQCTTITTITAVVRVCAVPRRIVPRLYRHVGTAVTKVMAASASNYVAPNDSKPRRR